MSYRKLALILGLNYEGSSHELGGCQNDADNLRELLPEYFRYNSDDITVMTDKSSGDLWPSRENILAQLERLINRVETENIEECWISFSGHGSYLNDTGGDERDGRDECICPLDVTTHGVILDDVINSYLRRIPSTCRVICLFDCCHSGTMGDLAYRYSYQLKPGRRRRVRQRVRRRIRRGRRWIYRYVRRWVWKTEPGRWVWAGQTQNQTGLPSHIITISGCRDPETSADVYYSHLGRWGGALTESFLKCIKNCQGQLSCGQLCQQLNEEMKRGKLSQQPVLATSYHLKPEDIFFRNPKTIKDCIKT